MDIVNNTICSKLTYEHKRELKKKRGKKRKVVCVFFVVMSRYYFCFFFRVNLIHRLILWWFLSYRLILFKDCRFSLVFVINCFVINVYFPVYICIKTLAVEFSLKWKCYRTEIKLCIGRRKVTLATLELLFASFYKLSRGRLGVWSVTLLPTNK